MKKTIAKVIEKSGLRRSSLYYQVQRWRQVKSLKPNLNHPKHKELLHTLDRDGIAIIPSFVSKESCEKMIEALDPIFAKMREEDEKKGVGVGERKTIRAWFVNKSAPVTQEFFDNPFLEEVAKAYIDPRAYVYRLEAELRDNTNVPFQQGDLPHFDDWRVRFKFFLYLTDVTIENAPFAFVKGTHKDADWKHKKNLEYERDGETGAYGHYFPQEINALKKQIPYEELVCTGTAGTLIIADFRGIHRGTPLKSGRRILLNAVYGI